MARTEVGRWIIGLGHEGTFGLRVNEIELASEEDLKGRENVSHMTISEDAKTMAIRVAVPVHDDVCDHECDLVRIPPAPLGDLWAVACERFGDPAEAAPDDADGSGTEPDGPPDQGNDNDAHAGDDEDEKSDKSVWRGAPKVQYKTRIVLTALRRRHHEARRCDALGPSTAMSFAVSSI